MSPTSFDDFDTTVGDLIRGRLASKGISQVEAASSLKLDVELLSMIENGEHHPPYPEHLVNVIVRDYALFLGLDPLEIRSLYWREVVENTLHGEGSHVGVVRKSDKSMNLPDILKKFFSSWN